MDGDWVVSRYGTRKRDSERFIFLAQKVMVLPSFNKTRAKRGVEAEFLTGHLDAETSYLLKAVLLWVHPVLFVFEELCRGGDSDAEV